MPFLDNDHEFDLWTHDSHHRSKGGGLTGKAPTEPIQAFRDILHFSLIVTWWLLEIQSFGRSWSGRSSPRDEPSYFWAEGQDSGHASWCLMIPGLSSSLWDFPKPRTSVSGLMREGSHALQLSSRRRERAALREGLSETRMLILSLWSSGRHVHQLVLGIWIAQICSKSGFVC